MISTAFLRGVLVWDDLGTAIPFVDHCKEIEREEPGSSFGFTCVSQDGLLGASFGVSSETMAMTSPLICVALRDVNTGLTRELRAWFRNWTKKRRGMPGVLAVIPSGAESNRGRGRRYFQAVANTAGMNFAWGLEEFHQNVREFAHEKLVAA
ncbi:MAG: hypothetical protein AAF555_11610 [Verrucomicrobiota bacterium]